MRKLLFYFELPREYLSLGFFFKSGQALHFLRYSAIILKLCRRDKSKNQIKLTFCREEEHTRGLQYIRDLGSRQSEIICSAKLDLDLSEDLTFYLSSNPVTNIKLLYKSGLQRKLQLLISSAFPWFSLNLLVLGCDSLLGSEIARGQASKLKMVTWSWSRFYAVVAKFSWLPGSIPD